jgi:L-threonylcarbamoyladenylate synthase
MTTDTQKKEQIEAIELLRAGKVILCPSDTLWGISCDATNADAVKQVFELKKRAANKSLIVLVSNEGMLQRHVQAVPDVAWELIDCSTSPLTIVFPQGKGLASQVLAEDGSVGIRLVKSGWCHELIHRFNRPLVSTSANISGNQAATTFDQIDPEITNQVDGIFGQGNALTGKASSVLKVGNHGEITILRK